MSYCLAYVTRGRLTRPFVILIAFAALVTAKLDGQAMDRITEGINPQKLVTLSSHHPRWASPQNDDGEVVGDLPVEHLTFVLSRSPEQQQALQAFMLQQQDPNSPEYHHWLTPSEYGRRFGLSDQDIATLSGWLESQGLHINWIAPSRMFVRFGGTAGAVGHAFHTQLHAYRATNGSERMSVSSDPMIPAALQPAVKAIHGLYSIEDHPFHAVTPSSSDNPDITSGSGAHFLVPADVATIYDYKGGSPAPETIAIVGRSRTNFNDFANFRQQTKASFSNPTEIVPTQFGGEDPGPAYTAPPTGNVSLDDQSEATLDVTQAAALDSTAKILLVVASEASGGIEADAQYLIQTNPVPAPVMSISFGACESAAGPAGVAYWNTLFEQAAAEGISVLVSSGDSGAAGCDEAFATPPAVPQANSPNYICSSSYATCVGGTEFNDTYNPAAYWNATSGLNLRSALGYIPEGAWNESLSNAYGSQVAASGGGVSSVIPTPAWQVGTGVPAARSGRYTPDLAFSAANHDGYFGCFAAAGGTCIAGSNGAFPFVVFSGTSAAAPLMAGITALLDASAGAPQGNLNPKLYPLAAAAPSAFHDVTVVSSGVTGCTLTAASLCNNSIPSPNGTGGQPGYLLAAGYDEVTGLGSLDITNFLQSFNSAGGGSGTLYTPVVSMMLSSNTISTEQTLTATVQVTAPSGAPGEPTGSVVVTGAGYTSSAVQLSGNSATVTIPAGSLALGNIALTATYTPDSASSSVFTAASGTTAVTVTTLAPPGFTMQASSLTTSPGAITGNSTVVAITPTGGFTGTVTLTAAITSAPAGAQHMPTVTFGNSSPVTITTNAGANATLTITTTAAANLQPAQGNQLSWYAAGGVSFACLCVLGVPRRSRRWRATLGMMMLLVTLSSGMIACGGNGGSTGSTTNANGAGNSNSGTTAGTYMVTVTGTSGTTTEIATVTVVVQ